MDDTGFNPSVVVIPAGGSVTWIERGLNVHTATSLGGAPQAFSTGGFGPFQSVSLTFITPGTYPYSSATDCLHGSNMPRFVCGGYYVVVVPASGNAPPGSSLPAGVPTWTPVPRATATPTVAPFTAISITDSAVSPAAVTVPVGGTVVWTNSGSQVHTATSMTGAPLAFDSGGLAPGQSSQMTFVLPGTYPYASAADCFGSHPPSAFDCGPYNVIVTGS